MTTPDDSLGALYFSDNKSKFSALLKDASAKISPLPEDPTAQRIRSRAALTVADNVNAGVKAQQTAYYKYYGAIYSNHGSRGVGADGALKDDTFPLLDENKDGKLQEGGVFGIGGDDYKVPKENVAEFTEAYAYATMVARVHKALIAGRQPTTEELKVDVPAATKALKAKYPDYATGFEFDGYDDNKDPTFYINEVMGDNSEKLTLPKGPVKAAESAAKPAAPKPAAPKPAPALGAERIVYTVDDLPTDRAYSAAFGLGNRDKGRGYIKNIKLHNPTTGVDVDLESAGFRKKTSTILARHRAAFDTGDEAQRHAVYKELQKAYHDTKGPEYLTAIGIFDEATQIRGMQEETPPQLTAARWDSWKKFRQHAEDIYNALKAEDKPAAPPPVEETTPQQTSEETTTPAPAAKPKAAAAPKPKLKAGAVVKVEGGDTLSKLALRSNELMATAKALANNGEIEGLPADASRLKVAAWVAGVIAEQSQIADGNQITVGQDVKLPTVDQLKAAAKPAVVEPAQPAAKTPSEQAAETFQRQKDEALKQQEVQRIAAEERTAREAAALKARTLNVTPAKDFSTLDVIHNGVTTDERIKDMVLRMRNGLADKKPESGERAAAMLLAAVNGLAKGDAEVTGTSLVLPTQDQIDAGLKALNETVAGHDSDGKRKVPLVGKKQGEEITLGELNANIPQKVVDAVKSK